MIGTITEHNKYYLVVADDQTIMGTEMGGANFLPLFSTIEEANVFMADLTDLRSQLPYKEIKVVEVQEPEWDWDKEGGEG